MNELFELRAKLSNRTNLILALIGLASILIIWYLLTAGADPIIATGILPKPGAVLRAFPELFNENQLVKNTCYSLGLNIMGYTEAILISIPVGFIIGLFPLTRGLYKKPIDSFRYLPLTALTGLFIIWFGLGTSMKIHFLAFGILIYLLPVVVQRIDEVKEVYLLTVYTLGANKWQTIKTVYIPSVISRLSDDIRVLTAISWTYIIIAESLGNEGGIGGLIWRTGQRQGRVDKLFALLVIIVLVGIIQDVIFSRVDKAIFPYKYEGVIKESKDQQINIFQTLFAFAGKIIFWLSMAIYTLLFINEFVPVISEVKILTDLFGDTVWVIHMYFLLFFGYQVRKLIVNKSKAKA